MDQVETWQNEHYEFPILAMENQNIVYDVPESRELAHVSSKRLGIHIEGRGQKSWYSIYLLTVSKNLSCGYYPV